MNGCRAKYSSLAAAALILAMGADVAAAQSLPKPTAPPGTPPSPVTQSALDEAAKPAVRPTFADIPAAPNDIRAFGAWRASIGDLKSAGVQTAAQASDYPYTLAFGETEGWAADQRRRADPPAPMTAPGGANTDAFVRDMIRRATPPPRAH